MQALLRKRSGVSSRCTRLLSVLALAGGLSACAQHQTMYTWSSYQPSVYAYLKGEDIDYRAQAQAMEENLESARASNKLLPPGFLAHLGLLYQQAGNYAKAVEMWQGEKAAFPESETFMYFLLRFQNDDQQAQVQDPSTNSSQG